MQLCGSLSKPDENMTTLLKINDDPMDDKRINHINVIQIDHFKDKSKISFETEALMMVSYLKNVCSKELFDVIKNEFQSGEIHETFVQKKIWDVGDTYIVAEVQVSSDFKEGDKVRVIVEKM